MCFVSPTMLLTIKHLGYFPFNYQDKSDCRSLWIDFDTDKLFGKEPILLPNPAHRQLSSRDPKLVTKYCESVYAHAISNNLFSLVDRLNSTTTPDHGLAEKIDTIIGQAMQSGETKCTRHFPPWYTVEIHCL